MIDTTRDQLIDGIESSPDDDVIRLIYADRLEELGQLERAEIIRLQIELARLNHHHPASDRAAREQPDREDLQCGCQPLRDRESELLREYESEFRRGPKCEVCGGDGKVQKGRCDAFMFGCEELGNDNCTHKAELIICSLCHGTGDAGGLMRRINVRHKVYGAYEKTDWIHTVEFHRGFPRVHCRMEECVKVTPLDPRAGLSDDLESYETPEPIITPTDWLLSVVRHHRGVEVWVTDREPSRHGDDYSWASERCLTHATALNPACRLPEVIFDNLPGDMRGIQFWRHYSSRELSQVELARAIPAWARGYLK